MVSIPDKRIPAGAGESWHPFYLDALEQLSNAYAALAERDHRIELLRARIEELMADPFIEARSVWASTIRRLNEWEALGDRMDGLMRAADLPPIERPWRPSVQRWARQLRVETAPHERQQEPWRDRKGHLHLPSIRVEV